MTVATPTKKARIWYMHRRQGANFAAIGRELGMDRSVVSRTYHALEEQGDDPDFYYQKPKSGRPRAITPRDERLAVRLIDTGRARDATDVQRELFPQLHPTTVRRMFIRKGLPGRVRRKKPWLSEKHIQKRFAWAEKYRNREIYFWRKVCFTDESKFNLFGSDGTQWCRRRVGEEYEERNVKHVVKHGGGSVMVWGCIFWNGPGRLHHIEGTMDAKMYVSILEEDLLGSLSDHQLAPQRIIFQQDGDPKHQSRLARRWLEDKNIQLLDWSPSSPDMSPIEHVWDHLDRQIRARGNKPSNLDELWVALQEEWSKIDLAYIRRLYESMPARVAALYKARGGRTKY